MVFYELGNGCDTCETVGGMIPNNVNMNMDPNSNMVANMSMSMPYGTQNNIPKQYTNTVSSGYGSQNYNNNMGNGSQNYNNNTSNGSNMAGQTIQTTQPTMVMVPATTVSTTTPNGQIIKQVIVPSHNSAPASSTTKKVEGFSDGSQNDSSNNMFMRQNCKMFLVLGLVIFSALAGNECCKYFLNKSLQMGDGSPLYYVAYIAVAVLLTYASFTYAVKN